jgi:nitroreductase
VDTWLAVASRREVREYDGRPLPEDVQRRILDAGRLAGSAQNRQAWRFVVVDSAERKEQLAKAVYVPGNVLGAAFVVAVMGKSGLDLGRCAQNMLLVAWNDGVGSVPNGIQDEAAAEEALGEVPAIVLTFGYAAKPRDPTRHSPEEWSERADRKSHDELVERV